MSMLRIGQNGSINEDKIESITSFIVVKNYSEDHDVIGHFIDNPESSLWNVYVTVSFRTTTVFYDANCWVHSIISGNRKMIAEIADKLCTLQKSDEFKSLHDKIMQDMIPTVRVNQTESLERMLERNMQDDNSLVCKAIADMIIKTCKNVETEFKNKKN